MTTAYTSLLGLALPVQGELSGTWGDVVNNSITNLLDTAVAGTTTLSTDADVTLTTTTGSANQARQAIILWTANGTVTRNITAPAQSKTYVVINKSAGTQSIVFRATGPTTGVTVLKDEAVVVAWNGSDFIKISTFGGAGTFSSVTITSGNLAFTGTGQRITGDFSNNVRANRTLFQTATVNSQTSVGAIPNGTSNTANFGLANTSDPDNAALLVMQVGASTVGFNSAKIGSGTTLPMLFSIDSLEQMRIDTSGNVGIGTASPGANKVNITSNVAAQSQVLALVQSYAGLATDVQWYNANNITSTTLITKRTDGGLWIYQSGADYIAAYTNNTERLRIDSSGNVNIATLGARITADFSNATATNRVAFQTSTANSTTSVSALPNGTATESNFTVSANSDPTNASIGQFRATASTVTLASTRTGTGTYLPLTFQTSASEQMRITTGGEVYIAGTTDQGAYNLQVNGTGVWGAGAYFNGSDARLKEDVQPLDSCLALIKSLRPVSFRYKQSYSKDQRVQPGFIAQELQVALAGRAYADGVVQSGPQYLNVAYQSLIPVLVKAVQELTARVAQLEQGV